MDLATIRKATSAISLLVLLLNTSLAGSAGSTVPAPPMDKVTFRVDMSSVGVNPSGVYLAGSFFSTIGLPNWTPLPMCNLGGGLWEISFCNVPPGDYQYKFLNGPGGWEFDGFGGPCTNPADNQNRFVTVTGGEQLIGPFGFNSCSTTGNTGGADTTPPIITGPAPASTTIACGSPLPPAVSLPASDGCDVNCTVTTGLPVDDDSGLNACGLGNIIRTWTVTDCAGNTTTATQTITLIDNIPPTITGPAPGPVTVGCDALPPGAPLPASDACDAGVASTGPPVDDASGLNACGVGVLLRTWTATDCAGNTTSITQAITLQDNAPPVITGAPPASIAVGCGAIPPAAPLAATDDCDAAVASTGPPVDDASGLNACGVGVIIRTWTVADCSGNAASFTQTITVQDVAPPTIDSPIPGNITVACNAIPPAAPLPASDDCDGSVATTGLPVDDVSGLGPCGAGAIIRTWTVTDCSGNTVTAAQTITVSDGQPPTISSPPPNISLNCGSPLPPALPLAASDNCDPTIITTGPPTDDNSGLDACGLGVLLRSWAVSDCSGNTATVTQSITLTDAVPPVITQPVPPNVVIDCDGALPPAVPLTASDNCGPSVILTGLPVDDTSGLDACGAGNVQRTWTVADCSGNITTATQTITIVDLEPPAILDAIPGDVVVSCSNLPPAAPLGAFDRCDANVFSTGLPVDDNSGLDACGAGQVIRTWTVTDCSGNSTSASQVITLVDSAPPSIDGPAPADVTVNCNNLPPPLPLAASDDCDVTVVSTGMPSDDNSGLNACGVGQVIRTWAVADCSGNVTTATQVITVVDDTPPTLIIPADATFDCNNIPPAAAADATATDDCSIPTVVYDGETVVGNGCPHEVHRSWTATDACGNSVSLTQIITVQDTTAPVFTGAPEDITVCEGSLPAMASLAWTDNCDGSGSVAGTEESDGATNPETITRSWAYTDACGNTASYIQTITVVAAPSVDAGVDVTFCEGEAVLLSATSSGGIDSAFWASTGDGVFDDAYSPNAIYTPGSGDLAAGQVSLLYSALPVAVSCLPATDTITVSFVPLPLADAGPEQQITCDDPVAVLGGAPVPGLSYEWNGPGIDSTNRNVPNPEVGAPGVYIMAVFTAVGGCSISDTVVVLTDTGFPVAEAGGSRAINCLHPTVVLNGGASSTGPDFAYSWSGPGIDASNQNEASPVVAVPGIYTLTVNNTANGCTAADVVEVVLDTLPPAADAGPGQVIDCNSPVATLNGSSSSAGPDITYQWLAPDGSPLGSDSLQAAAVAGRYTLIVTDTTNDCSANATVEVLVDTLPPSVNIGPSRVLTCTDTLLTLGAGGANSGGELAYTWARDGLPAGNDSTLAVSTPGVYSLIITDASNGCSSNDEVVVSENISTPVADAGAGGLLTCTDNCLALGGMNISIGPHFTYQWTGSSNTVPDANVPAPEVCAPGTYTLLVTDTTNGCTATDMAVVTEDASLPTAIAQSNDTLSCEVSAVALSGAGSSTGAEISYEWRDANGQVLSAALEATVTLPGQYTFTVVNTLTQCRSVATINVPIDTVAPVADAGPDEALDCASLAIELGGATGPAPGIEYQWQDEQGHILGAAATQPVSEPGTYVLVATDTRNGCQATDEVAVTDNIIYPQADAGTGRILDCTNSIAMLNGSGSSTGDNFTYSWTGPAFSSASLNPEVSLPGAYTLVVTDTTNACTAMDMVVVSIDTVIPAADAGPDGRLTCTVMEVLLDGSGSDQSGNMAYSWTDAAGTALGNERTLLVDSPGTYRLRIINTQNGCRADDEAVVVVDTLAPAANASVEGLLTCIQAEVTLEGTGSATGSNITYLWSGPAVAGDSTLLTAGASEPGLYTLTVANTDNGCTASATVEALQNVDAPVAFAGPAQELDCLETEVTLQGGASVPEAVFFWSGPGIDATNENQPDPGVGQPGQYSLVVTDISNGCTSPASIVSVADHRNLPAAEVAAPDSLDCLTPSVLLDGSNSARGDTIIYQWYYEGQPLGGAADSEWISDAPGIYVLEVRNSITGCTNTDTVTVVDNSEIPAVQARGETTLNCYQPVLQLSETAAAGLPNRSVEWTAAGGNILSFSQGGAAVEVDAGGRYIVTVLNTDNGCEQSDTIVVVEDLERPAVSLEGSYRLDCRDQLADIEPAFSAGADELRFDWSGPGFSGDVAAILVSEPGVYTLTATLLRNGCQSALATTVLESEGVESLAAEVIPPACLGDADGFIEVAVVAGGSPPYLFALDGGAFSPEQSFGPLPPGSYRLAVQDSEGCEAEQQLTIPEGEAFEANLGADIEITAGDSVQLSVQSFSEIAAYSWRGPGDSYMSCRDCPEPVVAPATTAVFQLQATSESGCRAEGVVTVFVTRRDGIYAPNVFSPNGDGKNDYFTVYPGQSAAQIRKLQVYGRWGTLLFEAENIPGGVPELGWGGQFKGSEMGPGVYVFRAEVVMPDGREELIEGEVLLLK